MLKKFSRFILSISVTLPLMFAHTTAFAEGAETDLAPNSLSAVLIDASTGKVLFEKNSHKPLPPASITKLMTMLLVMEAVDEGKISLKDQVRVSEYAASMGGTQIFLEPGEQMSVHDLLKGVAIASANDASVALAEYIGGTEENFVAMMNKRASELGLKNTHFQNSNGLPADNHYSSAYDIAIISRELLKHPRITQYTGVYQDYLRQNSKKPFWLVNTNKLVRFYPGLDGLKTGFTSEARFCLSATAQRKHLRVIAVVMGEPDAKTRNKEVSDMLDYAFNRYTSHLLYKKGAVIAEKAIEKGDPGVVRIRANQPFSLLMEKGEKISDYQQKWEWRKLKAPISKGDVLGKVQFLKDGKVEAELELVSAVDVQKANLWSSLKQVLKDVFYLPGNIREQD
ncbi:MULTISPECIES: D-alanyl-D-alanine carboxypeptidase family protein [Thermoactinomyces]|jgi:serine-type D-Ala-D-Ala carboxypeptidase (penicillin-binding protein 5/6)|uniref:serine-type D-Ala-D-Ala carboxypeptidase n=1 Tax=Thermoactinomyces daqus TaxID=1329516 RepID=A0A7W1XAF1_9BACL|nr:MULTISPECIES: D-alanyl-D-alanine carboxypeptidase family protein [Thermoactinomyces]MBA4543078.1 D-alanyl-D-alanine carboxypeptidase [Thermoactinomyces daqus]MBH8596687.1 D-alanyl-D-alanine carboxypeptidase [Thermoactinomyces sp. CICC 10523]MBH8603449.1 D-alanyl-D-alanine carboxypeptidase [Thermoactinomyces sp. CICC 10522]MBH8606614.1 D-alanyl-D-alanine carboxypeptidase [Thermoactinomyces sp. CICC 10521]